MEDTTVMSALVDEAPSERPVTVLSFDVGIKNLAFALVTFERNSVAADAESDDFDLAPLLTVLTFRSIDTTRYLDDEAKSVKKISVQNLARALIRALDASLSDALDGLVPDHVLVENQPCMKNPRMKSMQMLLLGYLARAFLEMPVDIRMFQPRDKLSVYRGEPVECTLKSAYSRRKRLAVEYTKRMLGPETARRTGFDVSKKKDDIADAYLQAATFVRREFYEKKKTKRRRRKKKGRAAVVVIDDDSTSMLGFGEARVIQDNG